MTTHLRFLRHREVTGRGDPDLKLHFWGSLRPGAESQLIGIHSTFKWAHILVRSQCRHDSTVVQVRDGISDATGQDLEAGHPVGYSVIFSQLQTVTRSALETTAPVTQSAPTPSCHHRILLLSLTNLIRYTGKAFFARKRDCRMSTFATQCLQAYLVLGKCSKIACRSLI